MIGMSSREEIREFIHGKRPWEKLTVAGFTLNPDNLTIRMEPPQEGHTQIEVTPKDIAMGLDNLSSSPRLRLWAWIVVAGPNFLNLSEEFESPEGEILLDALWDASFGNAPSGEAMSLVAKLIGKGAS